MDFNDFVKSGMRSLWRRKSTVTETKSREYNSIAKTQIIGGYAANKDLEDIYCGLDHNYDLAAGAYNKQLLTVSRLVGAPLINNGLYPRIQTLLFDEAIIITLRAMINGTHWALPRLLPDGSAGIEHIKDSVIGSGGLRIDHKTGALIAVVMNEQLEWLDGDFLNETKYAERRRKFTKEEIIEVWEGSVNTRETKRNTLGIMPVPFAFNSIGDIRGISAYAGVLRLLRDMHEIRRNRDEILARIKPKAIIKSSNWNEWTERNMNANGQKELYDPFAADVATIKPDEEFAFLSLPAGTIADHTAALDDNSKEQIVSSPLPEIFSGKMTTGNYASNEYQQQQGIQFVQSVRDEMLKSWKQLVGYLAELDNYMGFNTGNAPPEISWDNLELASPLTKSQVVLNMVNAVAQMVTDGVPVEMAFDTVKSLNPQMPYKTAGELADAIKAAQADKVSEDAMDTSSVWGA